MPTQNEVDTRRRVLRLLRLGWPVRRIAETLGISTQGVYHHKKNLIESGELKP